MIFFKVSWLPYICVIVGAIGLFFGEAETIVFSLLLLAGGIFWLVSKHKKKNAQSGEPAQDSSVNKNYNSTESTGTQNPGQDTEFCPRCGNAVKSGMYFCAKCGYKVR